MQHQPVLSVEGTGWLVITKQSREANATQPGFRQYAATERPPARCAAGSFFSGYATFFALALPMKLALEIAGGVLVLLALLPWIKTYRWWVRIWDFPRVQIAVALALVGGYYAWQYGIGTGWRPLLLGLMAVGFLNELWHIRRFTPFWRVQALRTREKSPRHSFSIMISNVRMANTRYRRFLQLVRENDPDIILINEPDGRWARHLGAVLNARYPYRIEKPLSNTYGMMLYSRFKLLHPRVRFLVEPDIPSFRATVVLPGSDRTFELFTVHPQPPQFQKDTDTREAELLLVAREVVATGRPSIVMGDLNDVAWSRTTDLFRRISGLLDPRIGRGFYNTYNAFVPLFRYSLDHVFYSPSFRLIRLKRLGFFGSDHFPILIRLTYEPHDADEHEVPEPEHHEVAEAHEMIEDGLKTGRESNGPPLPDETHRATPTPS